MRLVATPIHNAEPASGDSNSAGLPPFFSIPELAERWRCSRASVYNRIRGQKVVDFAARGKKGHKIVPLDVVLKIESRHTKVLR